MSDSEVREDVVAQLWPSFRPTFPAFARLNADLINSGHHYVQVDKPAQVAAIIENLVSTPT